MVSPSQQTTRTSFELDHAEVERGRLVLTGRWHGVRGMRFVRPTLVLDDRELLATLEHKPWAVFDDVPWTAAFPWAEDDAPELAGAQLAVGPAITVPLDPDAPPAEPSPLDGLAARAGRLEQEVDFLRGRREEELGAARHRITAVEDARDALRERLAVAEAAAAEVAPLRARLEAAASERAALRARLDELTVGDDERAALLARAERAESRFARVKAEAEQRLGQRAAEADALRAEVQQLREQLAAVEERGGEDEARALRAEVQRLREQLEAADERGGDDEARPLRAEVERLRERLAAAEAAPAPDAASLAAREAAVEHGIERLRAAEQRAQARADALSAAERQASRREHRLDECERRVAAAEAAAASAPPTPQGGVHGDLGADDAAQREEPIGVKAVRLEAEATLANITARDRLPGVDAWAQRIIASTAALSLLVLLVGLVRALT